jgi:hypothetical protein
MAFAASNNPSGFSTAVRDLWLHNNYMSLFTQKSPFFRLLAMMGQIKGTGYGDKMREPLMVPVDTGPQLQGNANGYQAVEPQPMTGYTEAHYNLSEYLINVSWEWYQARRAGGQTEMVNWIQSHYKNAITRSNNKLMNDLWAPPEGANTIGVRTQMASIRTFVNGGTTAATGASILPIQPNQSASPVVGTSGATAQTTVGDIPRAAAGAAYWCPSISRGDPFGTPGPTPLTVQVLNNGFEEADQDDEHPNLILMPSPLFGKLQNLLTVGGSNGGTFLNPTDTARFGFSSMYFRGAHIVVDRRCPSTGFISGTSTAVANHIFYLNLKHLTLRMSSNKPTFTKVVENKAIEQELGAMYLALTSDHLGNVHSMIFDITS